MGQCRYDLGSKPNHIVQLDITASPKQPRELAEEVVSETPDAVANESCRFCCFTLETFFLPACNGKVQREGRPTIHMREAHSALLLKNRMPLVRNKVEALSAF